MAAYYARICWNSENWRYPTGEAPKIENGTYVHRHKFGHEEWLFNFAWIIEGYHYSFLQPLNRSFNKHKGSTIDIVLYTIPDHGLRLYVARIRNCEVLTSEHADKALAIYREKGWLREMAKQVAEVGGKSDKILGEREGYLMFNMRFLPENYKPFVPYVVIGSDEPVYQYKRYQLHKTSEENLRQLQLPRRRGATSLRQTAPGTRRAAKSARIEYIHNNLQNELFKLLQNQFGESAVTMEEDFVDLKVETTDRLVYVEVKSDPRPRMAIREALGQLLEYALFQPRNDQRLPELYVVAPGWRTPEIDDYIRKLQDRFRIPIRYRTYFGGSSDFIL